MSSRIAGAPSRSSEMASNTNNTDMKAIKEMSHLLATGLDDKTLQICVELIQMGCNPEALASVVMHKRGEK
eukprot:CFRG1832T1